MIEILSEEMSAAWVSNSFPSISLKIGFHMNKQICCQWHVTLSLSEFTNNYNLFDSWTKSVLQEWKHFSSKEAVAASSYWSRQEKTQSLC